MKVSYNWLKDFVSVDLSPEQISEILTDTGLEVEGLEKVESIKGGLAGVVFGKVISVKPHPNADKLKLTQVDVGAGENLPIVCGAPNVAEGQNVVVALVGTTIYPGGEALKIKKAKIRGEVSEGMLCAEDELGLGASHDGILVIQDSVEPGAPVAPFFGVSQDFVYEIGLTPNRTDAMGHIGAARDIYAQQLRSNQRPQFTYPKVSNLPKAEPKVKVVVENSEACPRYMGLSLKNIKVEPSPAWLRDRLLSIGQKPINNIVDITNYVMHETGQPLHAFDMDVVEGEVRVKTLKEGTHFTTLDGDERKLRDQDLMICNGKDEPMCIAGVFGGESSGVSDSTTEVFLESAWFNPVWVRKTAKHHGLNTDASFRFERGTDPEGTEMALMRAADLMVEIAGAEVQGGASDFYPLKAHKIQIDFDLNRLNVLAGQEIEEEVLRKIFIGLEIEVLKTHESVWSLEIPTYRRDVTREADVVEEVLRIYGYNEIRLTGRINASLEQAPKFDPEKIQDRIADFLASNGFNECMSNSLTTVEYVNEEFPEELWVKMKNPLSRDLSLMRTSLLYSGLEAIERNQKRKRPDLKLFEFGKVYKRTDKGFEEAKKLGIFLSGDLHGLSWMNQGDSSLFFYGKSILERVLERLNLQFPKGKSFTSYHSREGLSFKLGKEELASISWVSDEVLKKLDVQGEVIYIELNWEFALSLASKKSMSYKAVSKYPAVRRDLALLIEKDVEFQALEGTAYRAEKKYLKSVDLFDVYEGKGLPAGKKSYALAFVLEDKEKTLSEKQIEKAMAKILTALEKENGAELRA